MQAPRSRTTATASRGARVRSLVAVVLYVTCSALVLGCDREPTGPKQPRRPRLEIITGDNQTGEVGTQLPVAPVVRLLDSLGQPMTGRVVTFSGDGPAAPDSAVTDASGRASVGKWTLHTRATRQSRVASVNLVDYRNGYLALAFHATAVAGRPATAGLISGDSALAIPGTQLDTLAAYVADRYGNRLIDAAVRWTVTEGGGRVDPVPPSRTDAKGVSRALWTLGPHVGRNVLQIAFGDTSAHFVANGAQPLIASTVIAGGDHSCALTPTGDAFCWGLNESGQLGGGSYDQWPARRKNAVRVHVTEPLVSLTAGGHHSCGLAASGAAYCWGSNAAGQLGDGTATNRFQPTPLNTGTAGFSALVAGGSHTCGLTRAGVALCWGDNTYGQLGDGSTVPHAVPLPVLGARTFTALAVGESFTCGIASDDQTYCWGANGSDQLGAPSADKCIADHDYYYGPFIEECSLRPIAVARDPGLVTITAGLYSACGMARDTGTYCWGAGTPYARAIGGTPHLTSVFTTADSACGLAEGGVVYCWDFGPDGATSPAWRLDSGGTVFGSVSAYAYHLCGVAIGAPAVANCWGANGAGQLGDGTTRRRLAPVQVAAPIQP